MNSTMSAKTETIHSDDLLIERIKAGDMAAYNDIVARYYDRIFARVSQLLKNKQDAEEVTQLLVFSTHFRLDWPPVL